MSNIIIYIAQETAMAPGIVARWPDIVPLPKNKNGRLKKIEKELTVEQIKILNEIFGEILFD